MMKHTRSYKTDVKTRNNENEMEISGYFAVFNETTELFPGAFEEIDPAAFNSQLNQDVRALINHDTRLVLGRTSANTLELEADGKGLYGKIKINPNDTDAVNMYERVKRGDVNQCSIGFDILDEESEYRDDGTVKWTLKDVKLYEVSVCTFPAYENTGVQARERQVEEHNERELQAWKEKMKGRLEKC